MAGGEINEKTRDEEGRNLLVALADALANCMTLSDPGTYSFLKGDGGFVNVVKTANAGTHVDALPHHQPKMKNT